MLIVEVMNSVAPYTMADKFTANFSIQDKQYVVTFDPPSEEEDPSEPVFISFDMTSATSGHQGELNMTNTGDEFLVFGTVMAIIQEYMKRYSPNAVTFSAEAKEPSRIKLYDRMVKRMANGWVVQTENLGTSAKVYTLTRRGT